jgi:cupin 2 domain-containing protein
MYPLTGNLITDLPINADDPESFETLINTEEILIERIVTNQSFSAPGNWYNQERDEWVLLLQGRAKIEFEKKEMHSLEKGDFLFIPAYKRHRVNVVSKSPNCIWLAIHGKLK